MNRLRGFTSIAGVVAIRAIASSIFAAILAWTMVALAPAAAGPTDSVAPVSVRVDNRTFPSIFEAWNPAQNFNRGPRDSIIPLSNLEDATASTARHDLYFDVPGRLGLNSTGTYRGLANDFKPESIAAALRKRATLLRDNPNIIILAPVNYYSAPPNYFPPGWSLTDSGGNLSLVYHEKERRIDFSKPQVQEAVVARCKAFIATGVYDGCMLDWWHDDTDTAARVSLIRKIRAAIGDRAILLGNVNGRLPAATATYLNGMYMEGFGSRVFSNWRQAAANLLWGQAHLRQPIITALEGWWNTGRDQYALMRQVTTLSLVFSNGYMVFSDPDGLPTRNHLHDWYPFWNKSLGRPVGPLASLDRPNLNGAYRRQYQRGAVVFNPPSNVPVAIQFDRDRRSAATGLTSKKFIVNPGDGDLFLD